jgi:phosphatidylethanolamine/phosphatidyl-N-methylethanolamine N-methyltransferase
MTELTMDGCHFFRAWIRDPLRVASITPSGKALADLIVREIGPETGRVIELGPGTGVFTRALLRRGVAEENILLVEKGAEFAALLQQRFPKARIACIDATDIARFCPEPAGAAISGLPLLSMWSQTVHAILGGTFARLGEGAALYQFTYGLRCPVPRAVLDDLGLSAARVGGTLRNVPPAFVYRISRKP